MSNFLISLLPLLSSIVIAMPILLLAFFGVFTLLHRPLSEKAIGNAVRVALITGF
jgi:hypothetical protein